MMTFKFYLCNFFYIDHVFLRKKEKNNRPFNAKNYFKNGNGNFDLKDAFGARCIIKNSNKLKVLIDYNEKDIRLNFIPMNFHKRTRDVILSLLLLLQ